MAKRGRSPDPVGEAFREVSWDAQSKREAATLPPARDQTTDRVTVILVVLVLVLIVLGVFALFKGWLPPG
jgi:hypothetical protein